MNEQSKRRGRPPKAAPTIDAVPQSGPRRRHRFITAAVPFVAPKPDVLAGYRKKHRPARRLTLQPNPV